jgi:hypothetical protein
VDSVFVSNWIGRGYVSFEWRMIRIGCECVSRDLDLLSPVRRRCYSLFRYRDVLLLVSAADKPVDIVLL